MTASQLDTDREILALCDRVRQTAFELHKFLRHGFLESVYENGLAYRLRKMGLHVETQCAMTVADEDGTVLGEYYADLVVERILIVELKACRHLVDEHMAQVFGYVRASGKRHAMLINFGSPVLELKKLVL